jgi:deoxyadenosine/deoxycytidine kinase
MLATDSAVSTLEGDLQMKSPPMSPKTLRTKNDYGWDVTGKNPEDLFLGVAGNIGAGKSTLCRRLAAKLGYKVAMESAEKNPYLDLFYRNMAKFSFQMQIYLLSERFRQHQSIIWGLRKNGMVQDRTIYEDPIFAELLHKDGLMSDLDHKTYVDLFQNMMSFLRFPHVII